MKKKVRVLVVDDYERWRRFAASTLQKTLELEIVGESADGLLAVERAAALQPDLILLDIGLPSQNGIEAALRIRELSPESKIIFVSENRSIEIAREAARAGARGYVVKSNAASELLPAVAAVLEGRYFSSSCLGQDPFTAMVTTQAQENSNLRREVAIPNGNGRCHEVAFYPDDASFVDGFAEFAKAAISDGSHVLVVATEPHRADIRKVLIEKGLNIEQAIQIGTFMEADAHELLSSLLVNGMPEPTRVERLAASMLAKRANAHSRKAGLAVCGELAPTLLANGNVEAAIQIEHFFDDFTKTNQIDVLCGYVGNRLPSNERHLVFERICAEHSVVREF